jgi:hypothetical protein
MNSNDIPVATIKEQPLVTPPFVADNTLVDDPVALVDDPVALVGGPTTTSPDIPRSIISTTPSLKIKRYS